MDAVRFIGNYSSGKMGYALAEEFAGAGANVILISGPVNITTAVPGINIIPVMQAEEMYRKSIELFPQITIAVMAAAVSDYTPEKKILRKIKRKEENLILSLKTTKDIAASLGKIKRKDQFLVGFALETDNETENARNKLRDKNLDLIVLNSLRDTGAGFQTDTNKVSLIDKNNNIDKFELKSKKEVAKDIVQKIISLKKNE